MLLFEALFTACLQARRLVRTANMKRILALLFVGCLAITRLLAQSVSVEIIVDREQYLVGEEFLIRANITNYSGQTLTLGNQEGWLTFSVESSSARLISQRKPVSLPGEFKLESAKVGKVPVALTPSFDLSQPGRYTVSANLRVPQLNAVVRAKPASFNVITGTVLWQQDFGAPANPKATNEAREHLKYALLQATQDRTLKLYSRLTDAKGARTYRVEEIGNLVSVSNIEEQIDQFSNLHVLFQNGRSSYLYSMINPDGVLIVRETHEITNNVRPSLRSLENGRIVVAGGVRRYAVNDLPPVLPNSDFVPPKPTEERKP